MKWYKFLTYFMLIAAAAVAIFSAIGQFTGAPYLREGLSPQAVYDVFPKLKNIDSLVGIVYIIAAGLYVYTFTLMLNLHKRAPTFINACYILNASISVFYTLSLSSELKLYPQTIATQVAMPIIGCVVMVLINKRYFGRRAYLFKYD